MHSVCVYVCGVLSGSWGLGRTSDHHLPCITAMFVCGVAATVHSASLHIRKEVVAAAADSAEMRVGAGVC